MKQKRAKKTIKVIALILAILLGIVAIYYFGALYPYYDCLKRVEFQIPGLNEKFVPQGFCYDDISDTYFVSGYMSDNSASRIYRVKDDSSYEYVTMSYNDKAHKGHMGGIAVYNNTIWVASSGKVFRLDKNAVLTTKNSQTVNAIDRFDPKNRASFITTQGGYLWVGEFYRDGNYETEESHYYTISESQINRAMAMRFTIDETKDCAVVSTTPNLGLSLPNQVQGITFTDDDKVVCSTSYSIASSHILVYDNVFDSKNQKTMQLFDSDFNFYVLSSNNLYKDIVAPSMSEELVFKDGRVYILYESACKKHALGNRRRLKNVESIIIE